jgi:hypothetical protein
MSHTVGAWFMAVAVAVSGYAVFSSMVPALLRRWPWPPDRRYLNRHPDAGDG